MTSRPTYYRDDPQSLLESRTGRGGNEVQLSLYEVDSRETRIRLRAPHLFYYGVLQGEKRILVDDQDPIYLGPGESLVVPPLQTVVVEFPNTEQQIVRYVALKIDRGYVQSVLDRLETSPVDSSEPGRWSPDDERYCHVEDREGVDRILRMIGYLFREAPPHQDRLIDLNAQELLIQLLQTEARSLLTGDLSRETSTGGLAAAVQYIQNNLDRHISIDELVEEALMSKSTFYRHFSDEFDMSPLEYITRERVIRARELLSNPDNTVTSVSHALGFSSTSHFIEMFKEHEGITPKQYQLEVTES